MKFRSMLTLVLVVAGILSSRTAFSAPLLNEFSFGNNIFGDTFELKGEEGSSEGAAVGNYFFAIFNATGTLLYQKGLSGLNYNSDGDIAPESGTGYLLFSMDQTVADLDLPSNVFGNAFTAFIFSATTASTNTDYDTNDDGVFDSTPWTSIDSISASLDGSGNSYSGSAFIFSNSGADTGVKYAGNEDANSNASWWTGDVKNDDITFNSTTGAPTGNLNVEPLVTFQNSTSLNWPPDGQYGSTNYSDMWVCPEPSSLLLSGLVGVGVAFRRKRAAKRKASAA